MASEITLKYLHPSVKTYITTENYSYDTSVSREVLFVADVFEHGKDNVLQQVNTLSEFLFKYGTPNLKKYGQAGYNIEKWLTNGNSAVIMRLLPEDASYAHAVLNIQYKNATNGKTVVNGAGNETKINDVYLRPLVTYIGVNNKSETLLETELNEDRTGYPTTDGYVDNFIFVVYPEGRGEYYNDLGFRIRLNPSYDGILTSRVYTFEVIKYSGSTYDIIDGPYYVSFDPDAIDPNSQKSMFIENVVNSYSEYIKIKFSTDNYIKLASIINDEVDPYVVDIISGTSRILPNGQYETYYSSATSKDEDVHISLRKYSSNGIALTNNGQYILNISNNDDSTSDIVDIADNSRRVIYNNQKYVIDYMKGYYNWLIQDRIKQNLSKIIDGNIESGYDNIKGLLLNKVENLIYSNKKDSDPYSYYYNNNEILSNKVGSNDGANHAWYLRAQEILKPGLENRTGYVGTENNTGFEDKDQVYTSTADMASVITEDGYISATNQHLISYYHNFMKYVQFVSNYDAYNNTGFVVSGKYLDFSTYYDLASVNSNVLVQYSNNGNTANYNKLKHKYSISSDTVGFKEVTKSDFEANSSGTAHPYYISILDYLLKNMMYKNKETDTEIFKSVGIDGAKVSETDFNNKFSYYLSNNINKIPLIPTYIDDNYEEDYYIPIVDLNTYNSDGTYNTMGEYIKVYDILGNLHLQPIKGLTVTAGKMYDAIKIKPLVEKYLYGMSNENNSIKSIENKICIMHTTKPDERTLKLTIKAKVDPESLKANQYNLSSINGLYDLLNTVYTTFNDNNFTNYTILVDPVTNNEINNVTSYNNYKNNKDNFKYKEIKLTDYIKFASAYLKNVLNVQKNNSLGATIPYPGTENEYYVMNAPISLFEIPATTISDNNEEIILNISKISSKTYFDSNQLNNYGKSNKPFNEVFSERLKNGKLTNSFNKVSSYASLISKELDGKGKDTIIDDITSKKMEDLDYSDYSLTTILNVFVGGFESIVNNMGSITDYSNYSSLKYLMKTINNNLDLRSTYLTLLSVHKNTVLDLSTNLAKNNASIILGEEALETMYTAMDTIVSETNYLITNIINTILNKQYKIYNVETMWRANSGKTKPYAYYFSDNLISNNPGEKVHYNDMVIENVDPLGVSNNLNNYGKKNDTTHYKGILPLLEKILINITGQNHYGEARDTIYGGPSLVSMYDDIKNGYVPGGLTQDRYEIMYRILTESLSYLSDVHNIINVFVNEKYISEIINTLVGTVDIQNTIIKYKGSTYSVNSIWDFYNSDSNDGKLTQTEVNNLINESLKVSLNTQPLPFSNEEAESHPVINYPYQCKIDIEDSINIAQENKDIVKSNILKQERVLSSLNTLCYDNLVTDINSPLGLAEGSDGSFTYDDSTASAIKLRQHRINDIRIKAYKGTWNPDVINKDLFEFDYIIDANYEDPVKNAIITLARDERQDFFYWADTKIQNTIQDCLDWKNGFTNQTYFMSIISQSQNWYDEYTSRNITLTSTYLIADMLGRHINSYGLQYPMAGSRRGVVGGFISNDWYPNDEQKEKLYSNKINYLEKDISTIRIGSQNTNYPTGPLGQINNMLVLLKIKRTVEKIAKTYQFEFNTADTRSAMASEINTYLGNWINNGACTVATAAVYASDYDIIQKIVRVDITLQFTGVIERIVINIDCPASI